MRTNEEEQEVKAEDEEEKAREGVGERPLPDTEAKVEEPTDIAGVLIFTTVGEKLEKARESAGERLFIDNGVEGADEEATAAADAAGVSAFKAVGKEQLNARD